MRARPWAAVTLLRQASVAPPAYGRSLAAFVGWTGWAGWAAAVEADAARSAEPAEGFETLGIEVAASVGRSHRILNRAPRGGMPAAA